MSRLFGSVSIIALLAVVLYFGFGPGHGLLYENPLGCVGVGLIGLGMCKHARERLGRSPAGC